jgi:hypothetical protein
MTKHEEIDLLKRNIHDLQRQLQDAYIRIKELNNEIPDGTGHGPAIVDDGWADETDIQIMSTSRGHNQ